MSNPSVPANGESNLIDSLKRKAEDGTGCPRGDEEAALAQNQKKRRVAPDDKIPPEAFGDLSFLQDYIYVDKTTLLGKIIAHREPFIFAPGMRRCGKSFTLLLLKAMAEGNREALQGMEICKDDVTTWQLPSAGTYTVIHLDFSGVSNDSSFGTVGQRVADFLRMEALQSGVGDIPDYCKSPSAILTYWIKKAAEEGANGGNLRRVVVLIDEYDHPLTPFLAVPDQLEIVAAALKEIFVTLKSMGSYIFKAFVTGGLKAGMSGLFSGPNVFYRLLDRESEYANLFGFTRDEIKRTYGNQITRIFPNAELDQSLDRMERFYNGYRVHPEQGESLLNPLSVVSYLHSRKLRRYWAATCTSGQLEGMLLRHGAEALRGYSIKWERLQRPVGRDAYASEWASILFQSGYLTISQVDGDEVILGPPNKEITEHLQEEVPRVLKALAINRGLINHVIAYSRLMASFEFHEAAKILTKVVCNLGFKLVNEIEFAGWVLHLLRPFAAESKDNFVVFSEDLQRPDTDECGEKATRFDGALVLKRDGIDYGVIVELKFDKTAKEAYTQISDRLYVERCKRCLLDKLQIDVADENWHFVGFNLTNVPKTIVSCCTVLPGNATS